MNLIKIYLRNNFQRLSFNQLSIQQGFQLLDEFNFFKQNIWCIMGDFLKKCCQCYWFSACACNVASCIDQWHSIEACGLSSLYCNACCWTLCAPLCIDCKLGQSGPAMENCTKGIKYCLFSCALCIAACVDGCYNCVKVIQLACGEGVKSYADLTKNAEFMGNKVKESLGLQTGNQPLRSMDTIKP